MAHNDKWLDGDTVISGGRTHRMVGVDTAETRHEGHPKGWSIDAYIAKDVAQGTNQRVVSSGNHDAYGRELSTLSADDGGLTSNERLVRAGLAGTTGSISTLPDDVARARHTRVRNALAGIDDSDEDVRNIGQLSRNLNRGLNSDRLQGVAVGSTPMRTRRDGNVLTNSLARGVDQTQMMMYGTAAALGNAIGNDSLQTWGEEGMLSNKYELSKNQPVTSSYKDVDGVGSAVTYAIERVSETAAQLAGTAGAAAIGAGIGALTTGGAGTIPGALAGAGVASGILNTGDAYNDMKEAGVKDAGAASLATGAAMGVLDTISLGKIGSAVLGGLGVKGRIAKETAGYLAAGKEIAKAVGVGAASEGITEGAQELVKEGGIRLAGGDTSKLDPLADRVIDSIIAGATVGGTLAGGGRTARETYDAHRAHKEEKGPRLAESAPNDASGNVVDEKGNLSKGATVTYDPAAEAVESEKGTAPEPVAEETQPTPEPVVEETQPTPEPVVEETQPTPEPVVEETQPAPEPVVEETQPAPEPVVEETQPAPEPVDSKSTFSGVNLRPLIDASLSDRSTMPPEVKSALRAYMSGGSQSKEAALTDERTRGAYVDQYSRDPEIRAVAEKAFADARQKLHNDIAELKSNNQYTAAKRAEAELKALNTYERTYRVENERKSIDFAAAKRSAVDSVVRDISNRHEDPESVVRAFRAAVKRNDRPTIERIIKNNTNAGFRNTQLLTQLITTDKTNIEDFAREYGDGTHTTEQVYDRIAGAYLIGQSNVFTDANKNGAARSVAESHKPKQQKQVVEQVEHKRPATEKKDLDAKAESDLNDYVRRAVSAAQRGETRLESRAFESVEDDSGESQVSVADSANDGIDPRNARQLEALLGATEAGWVNDRGESVRNNAEHKREVRKMYDGLVAQFPDKFKWVVSEREGREPTFHLIKAALKDGLIPMISAAETQTREDFTGIIRNKVDSLGAIGHISFVAQKTGNDKFFGLADFIRESTKPTEAQLNGLAAQFGRSRETIDKTLERIDTAIGAFLADIDSGADTKSAAVTAAQTFDESAENAALARYLREALNDIDTRRVTAETISHASEVLAKEDLTNALPDDIITRLTELGIMSGGVIDNNLRFVNRHGAVLSSTKRSDVMELKTSAGNVRKVNLPRLVSAIMDENTGENLTPAHAFTSAVQEAIARLSTVEDSHGYKLEDVAETFNALPATAVLYRSGARELTAGDYRGIMETIGETQNAADGYNQLNDLRKAAIQQMHEVIERYSPEGRDRYRKAHPVLWPIPHRAEKNAIRYRIEREQMDDLLRDVMVYDRGMFDLDSEAHASAEYQLRDVVDGKDPWNDFISDFLEAVDVVSNDDYSGENTRDLDYDSAKRTIDSSIQALKKISAWASADLRNKRNPEAGVNAGLSKELSKRVRALSTNLTRSYYRLAATQRKLTERHYALERIDELFGTTSTNERTERAFFGDGIETFMGEGLESATFSREDNVAHEFETTPRAYDIEFDQTQSKKRLSRDVRRVFVENMNIGDNFIVYTTENDRVTVTEFNGGKKGESYTFKNNDIERASMVGDKYDGWLALHYAEPNGLPIEVQSRVLAVDTREMISGADGLGVKGFEDSSDNLGFAHAQLFGVGELPSMPELIAKVARGAATFVGEKPKTVTKAGETINYFDSNQKIRFFGKGMRPLDVGVATPDGLRARNYRTVHDLITASGIKEQVNIIQGSDIVNTRVETVNGEYNIYLPQLTTQNAQTWLMSLGHEVGHILLNPYLNAFDKGALPDNTRGTLDKLYSGVLSGDKEAVEGFADSYAQHFVEPLIGKKVEVNEQSKHILGGIYARFKKLGQKIVDTLKSLINDFGEITGRRQKLNTAEQKAFLDTLAAERESMHEYLRDVNEQLLGKTKANPKLIGAAIRETLHALRPTFGRLESISPEVAAMFLATDDGTKPSYANLMRRYTRNVQGRAVMGELYSKHKAKDITKGYKDLVAGKDSEQGRAVKQWLKNACEMLQKDVDPNNINAYSARDLDAERVPYRLDPQKVEQNSATVRSMLEELGYTDADELVRAAIEGRNNTGVVTSWTAVLANNEHRAALGEYLDHNGVAVINSYIHNLAHTMSMRQAFGAHIRDRGGRLVRDDNGHAVFVPMAKLNHYVQRMNDTDAATVSAALRAVNGTYGYKMPQSVRKTFGAVNAIGNMAVLGLSGITNLMDSAVPLIMTGDTGTSLRALGKVLTSVKSRKEALEMAHNLGVIQYGVISNTVEGIFSGRNRAEGVLGWVVDKYFHLNGMHFTTKISRVMATAAAIENLRSGKKDPAARERHLKKFGITQQEVDTALGFLGGRDVNAMFDDEVMSRASEQQQVAVDKFRNAVTEFVDSYTLDPNEITDPLVASNPWFMLVTNLKRFAYAYHHTILRGQYAEVKARFGEKTGLSKLPHVLEPAFMTALFSLPLALASIWLREWARDGDVDRGNPFDKPTPALAKEIMDKSGILGVGDIVNNAANAVEYGTPWWLAATPSVGALYKAGLQAMDGKYDRAARTVIPLYGKVHPYTPDKWGVFNSRDE